MTALIPTPPASDGRPRRVPGWAGLLLGAAALLAVSLCVYGPALRGGWVWDDTEEIAGNPDLRDAAGLERIWFSPLGPDYLPLKSSVQWLEWHLWGDRVLGYHLLNVALHALNAVLLWRLLRRFGLRSGWWGGLLFAVHPLAVESVAWISELKNTLSLAFMLLAFRAYVDFDRAGGAGRWALSLVAFALAMLGKGSVAMLPVCLLLYLWWRHGRLGRRDLMATAPFFLVSIALGAVTLWFQARRASVGQDLGIGDAGHRLVGAARVVCFYLWKGIAPVGLMPIYPRWSISLGSIATVAPWVVLACLFAWFWRQRQGWGRGALLGFGLFAVNLAPVAGIVPMAYLRMSWVADHLAYISLAALAGLAAAGLDRLRRWPGAAAWGAAALALALAWVSRGYAGQFASDETLWAYAVAHNAAAWTAHNNLGLDLYRKGQIGEAEIHFREATRLRSDFEAAHVNLGNCLARDGKAPEAAREYELALRWRPDDTDALADLGNLELAEGRYGEAIGRYGAALRIRPADSSIQRSLAEAHYRNANALGNAGKVDEASDEYRAALRLEPSFVEAQANLGLALATQGREPEAIAELEAALRAKPDYPEAQAYLGLALAQAGRIDEAIAHYEEALRLQPKAGAVHYQLAVALRRAGRLLEAERHFRAAALYGAR